MQHKLVKSTAAAPLIARRYLKAYHTSQSKNLSSILFYLWPQTSAQKVEHPDKRVVLSINGHNETPHSYILYRLQKIYPEDHTKIPLKDSDITQEIWTAKSDLHQDS